MSLIFAIHADNPQARLLRKAVTILEEGGVIVYPSDSGYALGCALKEKTALQRIRALRQLGQEHLMTLICRDLSNLGVHAEVSKPIYRMLKAFTPGAYTFILNATKTIPALMVHPKRKTIGLRVPDHSITQALLEHLDAPLMSCSLLIPGADSSLASPAAIHDLLGKKIDLLIDGGECEHQPSTIVDLTSEYPVILREGLGDISPFININS